MLWLCSRFHSFLTLLSSLRDLFPASPWSLTALIDSFSQTQNSCCRFPWRARVRPPPCPDSRSGTDVSACTASSNQLPPSSITLSSYHVLLWVPRRSRAASPSRAAD